MDGPSDLVVVALVAIVAASLAASGATVDTSTAAIEGASNACTGTVKSPAPGTTVVSVQGARGTEKKTARLIAFGPDGSVEWVRPHGPDVVWGYDVDPTANETLFVTGTVRRDGEGDTRLFEIDPETGDRVWQDTRDALDTHDADLVGEDAVAVANMRNYDEDTEVNGDRLYIYGRTSGDVTAEWRFEDHYPRDVGGDYEDDWTHFNDVDEVDEDHYLLSPRNFDQVLLVDVATGEIELQLGEYGDHSVLRRQHNPDYLEDGDGTPTIIVGDSENDRVVEYAHAGTDDEGNDQWEQTWKVGEGQLRWPRDADRLPSGNTLITDSRNHRVLEVTPEGEVVWEVYTPWLPYDAERIGTGDGSNGSTTRDQGATGAYRLSGAAGHHENQSRLEACGEHLATFPDSTAQEWPPDYDHASAETRRGEDGTAPVATPGSLLAGAVVGLLVVVVLAVRYWYRS